MWSEDIQRESVTALAEKHGYRISVSYADWLGENPLGTSAPALAGTATGPNVPIAASAISPITTVGEPAEGDEPGVLDKAA